VKRKEKRNNKRKRETRTQTSIRRESGDYRQGRRQGYT